MSAGTEFEQLPQWPTWLLFILIIVNIFKQQIGSFFPTAIREHFQHRAKRQVDREEYGQLRESWREEQWVEMLNRDQSWIQGKLAAELKELRSLAAKQHAEQLRTNGLLTGINSNLTKLVDLAQERKVRWP